jgi:hypothetical protein
MHRSPGGKWIALLCVIPAPLGREADEQELPGPMHLKASSRFVIRTAPAPRSRRTHCPLGEQAEGAWVPALSREGLSDPRGAGMTLVECHAKRHTGPDTAPAGLTGAIHMKWKML